MSSYRFIPIKHSKIMFQLTTTLSSPCLVAPSLLPQTYSIRIQSVGNDWSAYHSYFFNRNIKCGSKHSASCYLLLVCCMRLFIASFLAVATLKKKDFGVGFLACFNRNNKYVCFLWYRAMHWYSTYIPPGSSSIQRLLTVCLDSVRPWKAINLTCSAVLYENCTQVTDLV